MGASWWKDDVQSGPDCLRYGKLLIMLVFAIPPTDGKQVRCNRIRLRAFLRGLGEFEARYVHT
jgi:hypothetical protein